MSLFGTIFGFEMPTQKSRYLAYYEGMAVQRDCANAELMAMQYELARNSMTVPAKTSRPTDLGPKQLQWCRDNLGNFATYQDQVLASKGETLHGREGK